MPLEPVGQWVLSCCWTLLQTCTFLAGFPRKTFYWTWFGCDKGWWDVHSFLSRRPLVPEIPILLFGTSLFTLTKSVNQMENLRNRKIWKTDCSIILQGMHKKKIFHLWLDSNPQLPSWKNQLDIQSTKPFIIIEISLHFCLFLRNSKTNTDPFYTSWGYSYTSPSCKSSHDWFCKSWTFS